MPDREALDAMHRVSVIRSISNKISSENEASDISSVMDDVGDLLDRSVGAREYIIRSSGETRSLVDLNKLEFEQLWMQLGVNKRTAVQLIKQDLEKRIDKAVRENATRIDLAGRFRDVIDEYNAGTHNIEEIFRRLKVLDSELSVEEACSELEEASADPVRYQEGRGDRAG